MVKATSVGKVFREKDARRRKLAALPFDEKIKILVRLQKIARDIKKDPTLPVWPIDIS